MNSVWYVKLPKEWKKIFDEMAKNSGYTERGSAPRELRRILQAWLVKEGYLE